MGNIIKLLRPRHWTKNLFCFAGLFIGGKLFYLDAILNSIIVFLLFSITASAIYVINDIIDRKNDSLHPQKKYRPIASGKVNVSTGAVIGITLALCSLICSYIFGLNTFIFIALYFVNNILYSLKLKHVPIIDVISIAFGFVLRFLSGIYAIGDLPTAWAVLCVLFLTLFLGFNKRRSEYVSSEERSLVEREQRPVLRRYTKDFLDSMIGDAALMTVLSYSLFTVVSGKNSTLIITVPIVYYAIMHYKQVVMIHNRGEEPEMILLKDRKIWLSIFLWIITFIVIFYFDIRLFT